MRTRGGIFPRRHQGGVARWYGRLPDGRRVALRPEGCGRATTDLQVAQALYAQALAEFQKAQLRAIHGLPTPTTLGTFAADHLVAKKVAGLVTEGWLVQAERHLTRAVAHFGTDRDLSTIGVKDVRGWDAALQARGLGGASRRHHLNTLSNMYARAAAEGYVVPAYNPVAALAEKPSANRVEAKWLEVPDAALLLRAAETYTPKRDDIALPFAFPLIGTFLLTGGRRAEVLGLEVDDVSLERATVTFRPNRWRRLKTATSARTIRLWPQLATMLKAYFPLREHLGPGTLLFPSFTPEEHMVTDTRKLLNAVGARGGWQPDTLYLRMFRHTYCAARLQTLDQGAPVSVYTVAKELGHGGDALVRRVYGHLGTVRHRAKVVEYRVSQHRKALKDRLAALERAQL